MSVDADLLERPGTDELRRVDRGDCALEIDRALRRLAAQESRCRLVFGTIAREFLGRRAHQRLGFARLGDYTRERFGWSAREVQDAARVVAAFDRLPHIAAAFRWGTLSWTKARMLVSAASASNELEWLAIADGRTVRALAARIANSRHETEAASDVSPRSTLDDEDGDTIDGEPLVRFRMRCPRRVRAAWRYGIELAERMSGARLPTWRAAEAIAAEGMSGAARIGSEDRNPDRERVGTSDPDADGCSYVPTGHAVGVGAGDSAYLDESHEGFAPLDWSAVREAIPDDVSALAYGLAGLDPAALDARLRAVSGAMRNVDWQIGRLLRLCFDLRLYLLMGFSSGSEYVRERLGISTRKARMLVAVERHTWRLPALLGAYRDGSVSSLQALTVVPVLDANVAEAWLQRASDVTLRRLSDEVGWALDRRDAATHWTSIAPPPLGAPLSRPERQMRAPGAWEECVAEVAFVGPLSAVALFRSAIGAFRRPGEPDWHGFERLVDHARAEWEAQPRHRDPVFERDGFRCAAPACSARRNLHDHHVEFRSRGGTNARDNRVTVCAAHHLHGIHTGRVTATGHAPHAIHWQLGVQRGRPPFLEFLGDTYVKAGGVGAVSSG